jgi:hypothetical protein
MCCKASITPAQKESKRIKHKVNKLNISLIFGSSKRREDGVIPDFLALVQPVKDELGGRVEDLDLGNDIMEA